MKMIRKNNKKTNLIKLTRSGISLIVLVITIIVILILAAAIILTLNNNNPIMEANKARYDSDVANMQAVFTNAVAKAMAHNKATVNVTAGQINSIITGVKETTGEVSYTVTDAMNVNNTNGKIVFGKGDNTDTVFYTGKQLPIYAAGDTKWYVDSEGNISLEVAGTQYGNGEILEVVELEAGIYDENDVLLASWDKLVNDYGMDAELDMNGNEGGNPFTFDDYDEFKTASKLVISDNITKLGSGCFTGNSKLKTVIIGESVQSIGDLAFSGCSHLESVSIPNSVTSIGSASFAVCDYLKTIIIPESVTSIASDAFIMAGRTYYYIL